MINRRVPVAAVIRRGKNLEPKSFGTKIPSSVTFAVGIILFFMPFIEIKCSSMTIQSVSGIQLATGFKVKSNADNSFLSGIESKNDFKMENADKKEGSNIYAALALFFGVLGFILSMMNLKAGGIGGLFMGILSSVALIGLMIDVGNRIKLKIPKGDEEAMNISIGLTSWFYITIIVFLGAAFFSYRRMKANNA
jgi:hypothetical protein